MLSEIDEPFVIVHAAKENILVSVDGIGVAAVSLQQAVDSNERDVEMTVVLIIEAADEVDPDNPVADRKQDGCSQADGAELAEKQEQVEAEIEAVDEDVTVRPQAAQLVDIEESDDAREETLQESDADDGCLLVHLRIDIQIPFCIIAQVIGKEDD